MVGGVAMPSPLAARNGMEKRSGKKETEQATTENKISPHFQKLQVA